MSNKLSYSKADTYNICPKSYEFKYVDKIQSTTLSSALLFGSAFDEALNFLLTGASLKQAKQVFIDKLETFNGVYMPTNENISYTLSDFDANIIGEVDRRKLVKALELDTEQINEVYASLKDRRKEIKGKEKKTFNMLSWVSMLNKGLLMLDSYEKNVMPLITKVISVQEKVNITNQDGDQINGLVDLVAELKGHDGSIILDNKTASKKYKEDSVVTSGQLSLYTHILKSKYKTRKAGYIVLDKKVNLNRIKICKTCGFNGGNKQHKTCFNTIEGKRCGGDWNETINPSIDVQIIIDEIPKETEKTVLENMDIINDKIKNKEFPKNEQSCSNYFGKPCDYYGLCHFGSMEGLVKSDKK